MNLIPIDQIFKDGIDGTMISYWPCKRKFYNRFVRGLDTPQVSSSIRFGQAVDRVLEGYFKRELDEKQAIEAFSEIYEDKGDDDRRTTERGATILKLYFQQFPRDTETFEILEIQEPFKLDIGAMVPFCGKPDMVVKDRISGDVLPFDNKTTTFYGDNFRDKFEIDTSTEGYIYYCRKKYGGSFRARFNVLIPQKTKPRCDRFDISKSDEQIAFWEKRTRRVIDEITRLVTDHYDDVDAFTLADSRCTDFNSRCMYFDLCKYCDKTELIEGDFTQRVWSPFNKQERVKNAIQGS